MPATDSVLNGDDVLIAVTAAMVDLHQRYHHRQPVTAVEIELFLLTPSEDPDGSRAER